MQTHVWNDKEKCLYCGKKMNDKKLELICKSGITRMEDISNAIKGFKK